MFSYSFAISLLSDLTIHSLVLAERKCFNHLSFFLMHQEIRKNSSKH